MDEATVKVVELTPMLSRKAVSPAVTEDVLAPLTNSGGHGAYLQHAGDEVAEVGTVGEHGGPLVFFPLNHSSPS